MSKHLVECTGVDHVTGYWIVVFVDLLPYDHIGPFDTARERDAAKDDIEQMLRSVGAQDVPHIKQ